VAVTQSSVSVFLRSQLVALSHLLRSQILRNLLPIGSDILPQELPSNEQKHPDHLVGR